MPLGAGAAFIPVKPEMTGFGSSISSGLKRTLVAAGVGTALAAGFKTALGNAKLTDKLSASLGTSTKVAEKHGKIASRLYAGAWGDSMEDVNIALGSVASSFPKLGKKAGPQLERLTAKALDFAGVFDIDVPRATAVASTVVKSGLAKNAGEAFDLMTRSAQKVPAALRENVLDAAEEYSGFFNTLGIDGPQAFGILAEGAKKGQFGIDKAGDAIKEFTIRATDGSTATEDAMDAMGLHAGRVGSLITKGGDDANHAFKEVLGGLLSIKNPAEQAQAAIALFGTPLEDLNVKDIPAFLQSLQNGTKGLDNWRGATERAGDTLNDNASTRITSWTRTAKTAFVNVLGGQVIPKLEEWGGWIRDEGGPMLQKLTTFVKDNSTAFTIAGTVIAALTAGLIAYRTTVAVITAVTKAWTVVQLALNSALLLNPIGLVIAAVVAIGVALVVAYKKSDTFRAIVDKAFSVVKKGAGLLWEGIKLYFGFVIGIWKTAFKVVGTLVGGVRSAFGGIRDAVGAVAGFVGDKVGAMIDGFTSLPRKVSALGGRLKEAGQTVMGKLFDGIKAAAGAVGGFVSDFASRIAKAIKGAANNILGLPRSISLGGKLGIPKVEFTIPAFADGGIAPGGAALVGERGRELVVLPRGARVIPNRKTEQILHSSTMSAISTHARTPRPVATEGFPEARVDRRREVHNHFPTADPAAATAAAARSVTALDAVGF